MPGNAEHLDALQRCRRRATVRRFAGQGAARLGDEYAAVDSELLLTGRNRDKDLGQEVNVRLGSGAGQCNSRFFRDLDGPFAIALHLLSGLP